MDGGEAVEAGATPLTEGERHTPLDGPQTPAWLSVARHELDSPLEPSVVEASALRGKLEAAAAETSQLRQRLAAAEERAAEAAEAAAERAAEAAAAASDSASLEGEAAEDAVWQAAAARGREEAVEEVRQLRARLVEMEARAAEAEGRAEAAEAAAAERGAVVARLQQRTQEALAAAEATRRGAEEAAAEERTQLRRKLATVEARAAEAEVAAAEAEAEAARRREARATYAGLAAAAAAEEGEGSTRRPSFFAKLLGCTAGVSTRGGVYTATPVRSPTGSRSGAAEHLGGVPLGGPPPLAEELVEEKEDRAALVGSKTRDSSSVEESS